MENRKMEFNGKTKIKEVAQLIDVNVYDRTATFNVACIFDVTVNITERNPIDGLIKELKTLDIETVEELATASILCNIFNEKITSLNKAIAKYNRKFEQALILPLVFDENDAREKLLNDYDCFSEKDVTEMLKHIKYYNAGATIECY